MFSPGFCARQRQIERALESPKKKAKHKLKNYKLKHSRMLTCYSELAPLWWTPGKGVRSTRVCHSFRGQLTRHTRSPTYASQTSLPTPSQGWLPAGWLTLRRAGFAPARQLLEVSRTYRVIHSSSTSRAWSHCPDYELAIKTGMETTRPSTGCTIPSQVSWNACSTSLTVRSLSTQLMSRHRRGPRAVHAPSLARLQGRSLFSSKSRTWRGEFDGMRRGSARCGLRSVGPRTFRSSN